MRGVKKLIDYEEVKEIADGIGASPAQVLLAWATYDGCSVIPKSVHEGKSIPHPKKNSI